jgi:hypothetical protein
MAEKKKVVRNAFKKLVDDDQSGLKDAFEKVNPRRGFIKKPQIDDPFKSGMRHPAQDAI